MFYNHYWDFFYRKCRIFYADFFYITAWILYLYAGPLGDGALVGVLDEEDVQGGQHDSQRQHLSHQGASN